MTFSHACALKMKSKTVMDTVLFHEIHCIKGDIHLPILFIVQYDGEINTVESLMKLYVRMMTHKYRGSIVALFDK